MESSYSIESEIKKKSFKASAKVSLAFYLIVSIFFFSNQVSEKRERVEEKVKIDSSFLVNALKIGDLFFITKYLNALLDSNIVNFCGLRKGEEGKWIEFVSSENLQETVPKVGVALGLRYTNVTRVFILKGSYGETWQFVYTYRVDNEILLLIAFLSIFVSIILFFFFESLFSGIAKFFTNPVEKLVLDIEMQKGTIQNTFDTKNYNESYRFKETDLLVVELKNLVSTISDQKDKIKDTEIQAALVKMSRQVSHDIQSPIGALKTAIGHIDVNKDKSITLIQKSVARVEDILQDLKVKNPETPISYRIKQATDINAFLEEVVTEKVSEFIGKAKIEFFRNDKIIQCELDRVQIARVISNIINNGVEAVPPGFYPEVLVKVEIELDEVLLQFFDNGPGIRKEKRSLVTQYGFSEGKENGSGTGLSHALVVIENHEGKLEFLGKGQNGLNLVQIRLPLS